METLLLSLIVMVAIVLIMSVGVLAGRKPISGSCGGLSAIGIDGKCEICGATPEEKCRADDMPEEGVQAAANENQQPDNKNPGISNPGLAYDATEKGSTKTSG